MDPLTKEQRHKNMSNIRSKDTKIEIQLRKLYGIRGIDTGKIINPCLESRI